MFLVQGRQWSGTARHRREVAAREDWRVDVGKRFFRGRAQQGGIAERKAMIDREHDLPITKQADVLRISRGSVYYLPRPVSATDLEIMRRLDRLHLEFPFAGSRMLRGLLAAEGCKIGRRHVKTLMRRMGIEALYRRPRTTKPAARAQDLPVSSARDADHAAEPGVGDGHHLHHDGAWLRLSGCRARLVQPRRTVVETNRSRWRRRICVETLEDALARHGKPDIFKTDQGSQFTGSVFTGVLANKDIAISMDGKRAWRDNVFVERQWRTVTYEDDVSTCLRKRQPRRAVQSAVTLNFTMAGAHTRAMTASTADKAYFASHATPLGSLTPAHGCTYRHAANLFRNLGQPQSYGR